jgi:hypothetical protein
VIFLASVNLGRYDDCEGYWRGGGLDARRAAGLICRGADSGSVANVRRGGEDHEWWGTRLSDFTPD